MIEGAIEVCNELGIDIGICGQEPSNNPDFARKLVEFGIGSMGVTPDRFLATYRLARQTEENLSTKQASISL